MDRAALLRGLRRERDQQLHCWRIPFAIASYFIAATSLVLHLQVEPSFFLERGLVDSIVTRTSGVNSVVSTATLFDFLRDELLPAAFPSRTDGVLGAINSYSQILGGIRLSQARSSEQPCPPILGINLTTVLRGAPAECHPESTTSRGTFGLAAVAALHNVSSAFSAMDAPGSVPAAVRAEFDPFEFVVDAHDDFGEAVELVDGLQAALWVDASTKHVSVEIAVLNLEIAAWARLLVTFTFTRGGRVASKWAVRSLPFDPYSSAPVLGVFDVLNILYAAYLLATIAASTWRRAVQAARDSRLPGKGCGSAIVSNFDAWWLVDVACALCLGEWWV